MQLQPSHCLGTREINGDGELKFNRVIWVNKIVTECSVCLDEHKAKMFTETLDIENLPYKVEDAEKTT